MGLIRNGLLTLLSNVMKSFLFLNELLSTFVTLQNHTMMNLSSMLNKFIICVKFFAIFFTFEFFLKYVHKSID